MRVVVIGNDCATRDMRRERIERRRLIDVYHCHSGNSLYREHTAAMIATEDVETGRCARAEWLQKELDGKKIKGFFRRLFG